MTKEQILELLNCAEQPSKDYAKTLWKCGMYNKETPATPEDLEFAFKAGAKWMTEQLLSKDGE